MRTLPAQTGGGADSAVNQEPLYLLKLSWDDDDSDYTYLTSHDEEALGADETAQVTASTATSVVTDRLVCATVDFVALGVQVGDFVLNSANLNWSAVLSVVDANNLILSWDQFTSLDAFVIYQTFDSIGDVVIDITGQTQKINPDIATSTIGAVNVKVLDLNSAITNRINSRLDNNLQGLRGKKARLYVGNSHTPLSGYDLRLTYIIDGISFDEGIYTFNLIDIQRETRRKILTPDEVFLEKYINETTKIIPLATSTTNIFPLVHRGTETSNYPNQNVTFIKIDDEVISINSRAQFDTTFGWHVTVLQRGALGTRPAKHGSAEGTNTRKVGVVEHIYLEGPAPKVIYGLLTGLIYHGKGTLQNPFDFTQWAQVSGVTTAESSANSPVGWGKAYIIDDNVGSFAFIRGSGGSGYIHGETWTASLFILKEAIAGTTLLRISFFGGAATSYVNLTLNTNTGVISSGAVAGTVVKAQVIDFDDDWWHVTISGNSTTTGTTQIGVDFYPAAASAASLDAATIFGAALIKGDNLGMTALPLHWHLGIDKNFVKLSDFQSLGADFWDLDNNSGRWARIENPGSQDGKRFIEKELLVWLGAFMPVYSTGELGIKRLTRILSNSPSQVLLNDENVVSYGALKHAFRKVINDIRVHWNWVDQREEFTKESIFVDATSINENGVADEKVFKFKTVHTGVHTDENILAYFDTLRDRYSGPPLELTLRLIPSMHILEVGDTVHVELTQIRDMNTGGTLTRTFEVQQVTTNWRTGMISLALFASSAAAGEIDRTELNSVMQNSWFSSEGQWLDSSGSPAGPLTIVGGHVTANGTITGATDMTADGAIYYYLGDLTIDAGVTVTITDNVQLRIRGNLTVNGAINGVGHGPNGGTGISVFTTGSGSDTFYNVRLTTVSASYYDPLKPYREVLSASDHGWFGIVKSGISFLLVGFNVGQPPTNYAKTIINVARNVHISPIPVYTPTEGNVSDVGWFDIKNPKGWGLPGLPGDLTGRGAPGGLPLATINDQTYPTASTSVIRANGGAGGDGGAGLCVIARGMSFGASGSIDLSGGTAGAPGSYTVNGKQMYAGHGGGGAPGAFLLLMDGNYTNPDISSTVFTANYGAVGSAGGAREFSKEEWYALSVANKKVSSTAVTPAVFNKGEGAAAQDTPSWASAYRLQYLPEADNPFDNGNAPDDFGGTLGVRSLSALTDRGEFNDLLLWQYGSVIADDRQGAAVDVTPDGSRFVHTRRGEISGGPQDAVMITRSVKNPIEEQLITRPASSVSFGYKVIISDDGSRIAVSDPTFGAAGRVYIYSRTGHTWSLEQTLTAGGGGGSSNFGNMISWNVTADKLLIYNNVAGRKVEYWIRTGTAWTFVEYLAETLTAGTINYPGGIEISGDGLSCVTAAGTDNNKGTVYYYELTTGTPKWVLRDTLNVPDYDADPFNHIGWNIGGAGFFHSAARINHNGSAIAVMGIRDAADGGGTFLHAIEVQGTALKYVGRTELTFDNPDGVMGNPRISTLSNNGLLVCVYDILGTGSGGTGAAALYRRNNTSEPFLFSHMFDSNDDAGGFGQDEAVTMGKSGQFVIIGQTLSDFGANNSGHIEIWEYYPEAD